MLFDLTNPKEITEATVNSSLENAITFFEKKKKEKAEIEEIKKLMKKYSI